MSTSFPIVPCAIKSFNPESKKWESAPLLPTIAKSKPSPVHDREGKVVTGDRLRFCTFNVLADSFPKVVELAIDSPLRFRHLPAQLANVQANVYGLNEVTRNSVTAIQNDPYFQNSGYNCVYFDDLAEKNDPRNAEHKALTKEESKMLRSHGCALFIQNDVEVVDAFRIHLSKACAPVGAILRIPPQTEEEAEAEKKSNQQTFIGVVALHTSAYADEANRVARKNQIGGAKKVMEEMLQKTRARRELNELSDFDKNKKDVVVIMGDLNLHDINEEKTLLELDLLDCFGETQYSLPANASAITTAQSAQYQSRPLAKRLGLSKAWKMIADKTEQERNSQDSLFAHLVHTMTVFDYGCTFNAVLNPMIPHYIPGEQRQMRLDRITIRSGCKAYLDGLTEVVFQHVLPSTGSNICLSDHYGLVQNVVILRDDNIDSSKLRDTDIPDLTYTGVVNRSSPDNGGNDVAATARRLVGRPIVRQVREHLANLPKDVTGVWSSPGGMILKGLSWVAHPFFLLGRSVGVI